MLRSVVVAALALTTVFSAHVGVAAADASARAPGPSTRGHTGVSARARAEVALRTTRRVLAGVAPRTDASMALLRLRLTMHALSPTDRREAAAILARPTDHPDLYGESYSREAKRACAGHICIHWVPTTRDAPPSRHWVDRMLRMMSHVWDYEVHRLGYRRPIPDGTRGGGGPGRFDVYLKELYHRGLYGMTVPERPTSHNKRRYSSYLVLDNDFKRSQFHADPMQVARVTAAHEFFHAIQYGYDAGEDAWLMEATATWMEDQFADSSNDNRQYLPWSQLKRPGTPLDTFSSTGFEQYGNWVFFEYLSEHFGRRVVRRIWNRAAEFHPGGHLFSAAAIRAALRGHGGLTSVFGAYANANTVPARTYEEGRFYPAAGYAARTTLTKASPRTAWATYRVSHLSSVDLEAVPGSDLSSGRWRLRVAVDGPRPWTSPTVVVLVTRKHRPMTSTPVQLSRTGQGSVRVPFSTRTTVSVTVTLANASTRFRCDTDGGWSCNGTPEAPHPAFAVKLVAVRR